MGEVTQKIVLALYSARLVVILHRKSRCTIYIIYIMCKKCPYDRITIKVGSNVLTREDGTLDVTRLSALVDQIATLRRAGIQVILVSSGAVASGRNELHLDTSSMMEMDSVEQRQLFSAVGQAKLINRYFEFFREHHIAVGQVLTMKEDFETENHRQNLHTCMSVMLQHGVLPVVNENDTVCITELMFTDNDELSGLIARMMNADALIILSNIDGIYDGNPQDAASKVIPEVDADCAIEDYIQQERSSAGRGGMQSKCRTARTVAECGIHVMIANGKRDNVLTDLVFNPQNIQHTHFCPKSNL